MNRSIEDTLPWDFPKRPGVGEEEALLDWHICDEVVEHTVRECRQEKERRPLLPEVEILDVYFRHACQLGWGTPEELHWVFVRAAAKLRCGVPESLWKE